MKSMVLIITYIHLISASYELIGYWGQLGSVPLSTSAFDIYTQINVAFVYEFPSLTCTVNGSSITYVGMNFAGNCYTMYDPSCTDLLSCPSIGSDIQARQQKGQRILISFGGSSKHLYFIRTYV
jgi:hypothetical protein